MRTGRFLKSLFACAASLALLPGGHGVAQQPSPPPGGSAAAAGDIADFFSQVGDQIYEDCIFELSQEQLEVQQALIEAYIKHGAPSAVARQFAVRQIQPPKLSHQVRADPGPSQSRTPQLRRRATARAKKAGIAGGLPKPRPNHRRRQSPLADKKVLPQWDCAPDVDFVTIQHKGYERKLTDGEICNPFDDVVREVPESVTSFRLGYTIKTGRLFVISDDPQVERQDHRLGHLRQGGVPKQSRSGLSRRPGHRPPASGRICFRADKDRRVSWGPTSKRMVAGIYLTKLWNRDRYSPAQTAAILTRGNIAIHVRLKGEMSEACLGLGPNGWAYVASLIKDGRATGVNVYIDEPYPQIAERPPVVRLPSFSLTSLFK